MELVDADPSAELEASVAKGEARFASSLAKFAEGSVPIAAVESELLRFDDFASEDFENGFRKFLKTDGIVVSLGGKSERVYQIGDTVTAAESRVGRGMMNGNERA